MNAGERRNSEGPRPTKVSRSLTEARKASDQEHAKALVRLNRKVAKAKNAWGGSCMSFCEFPAATQHLRTKRRCSITRAVKARAESAYSPRANSPAFRRCEKRAGYRSSVVTRNARARTKISTSESPRICASIFASVPLGISCPATPQRADRTSWVRFCATRNLRIVAPQALRCCSISELDDRGRGWCNCSVLEQSASASFLGFTLCARQLRHDENLSTNNAEPNRTTMRTKLLHRFLAAVLLITVLSPASVTAQPLDGFYSGTMTIHTRPAEFTRRVITNVRIAAQIRGESLVIVQGPDSIFAPAPSEPAEALRVLRFTISQSEVTDSEGGSFSILRQSPTRLYFAIGRGQSSPFQGFINLTRRGQ